LQAIAKITGKIIGGAHKETLSRNGCSPKANLFFPAKSGKKRVVLFTRIAHFWQSFSLSVSSVSCSKFSICVNLRQSAGNSGFGCESPRCVLLFKTSHSSCHPSAFYFAFCLPPSAFFSHDCA
jgi:hypothetical protein